MSGAPAKSEERRARAREWRSSRRWTPDSHWLPRRFIRLLDAEGTVRGKTWRDMPGGAGGGHMQQDVQALNWFLWKRGLLHTRRERAEMSFQLSLMQREAENA
jgi:hypothetical protein